MKQFSSPNTDSKRVDYLILTIVTLAIYIRSLGHEFQMSWDDNWYLVYNESIRGFSLQNIKTIFTSIYQANYAPLQMLSYMLDYSMWGMNPGGFLATNILLHILNGLLLYRLLLTLHGKRLFALVATAFFLVHPLQVESVAWISCRKNVLSLFLFLLSWEAYRRYREADTGQGRSAYIFSLTAFTLSLMAKSTTLVLPLILFLYDICFLSNKQRLFLKDKLPYLLAAVIFAMISMHFQHTDFQGGIRVPYHGGSPLATLYTMLPVFCLYLARLVWPSDLSAIYDPAVHTSPDGIVVLSAMIIAIIVWAGIRLFIYDRRLAFWLFFFWIGLLPFAQIVPIQWLMTDRYINVSIIGAAVLTGALAYHLSIRLASKGQMVLYGLIALCLIALSVTSFQRVGIWKDSLTLWSDAAAKEPNSSKVLEHYGEALRSSGNTAEAMRVYERVLALDPENTEMLSGLGDMYTEANQLEKGQALLEKLLKIRPSYVIGWAGLGTNYMAQGRFAEAADAYQRAETLQPESWQVALLQGRLAYIQGHFEMAKTYFNRIESQKIDNPESAYHLACIELKAGNRGQALAWLEKALQRGFNDFSRLREDQNLSALWNDPRFNSMLQRYFH